MGSHRGDAAESGVRAAEAEAEFHAEQRDEKGAIFGEFGGRDCHGV